MILLPVLYFVLYCFVAILVVELILWLLGMFFIIPPKIRQILYAIVGVILIIYLVQFFIGIPVPVRLR